MNNPQPGIEIRTDVLVIGGGPAAAWAALGAAGQGARVVLADKGWFGASGALAAGTSSMKVLPPVRELRDPVKFERYAMGGYLARHAWWDRLLDITFENAPKVYEWGGCERPVFDGLLAVRGLRGCETMRILRRQVRKSGALILDQSPALELLTDREGAVAGARGIRRQEERPWTVRAGAVVMATGGCAWLSKALGCNTNTGDGLLMAVEAGGELSGMEFSAHYVPVVKNSSVTQSSYFRHASLYDASGKLLEGLSRNGRRSTSAIAAELLKGPVYVTLNQAGVERPEMRELLRLIHPNLFSAFDKAGIDPFRDRWEISLRLEGTVRGVGGIRIANDDCGTTVPGLYAAGDAATRELICGGFTGGGGPNMTWAIGSGTIAGQAAARHARRLGRRAAGRKAFAVGGAGLRPHGRRGGTFDAGEVIRGVQEEIFPYDKNIFRTEQGLRRSLTRLEGLWSEARKAPRRDTVQNLQRSREAASLVAAARWSYFSGLERRETRGMHKRTDYPASDPAQRHYLAAGGLETPWVRPEPVGEEIVPAPQAGPAAHTAGAA